MVGGVSAAAEIRIRDQYVVSNSACVFEHSRVGVFGRVVFVVIFSGIDFAVL